MQKNSSDTDFVLLNPNHLDEFVKALQKLNINNQHMEDDNVYILKIMKAFYFFSIAYIVVEMILYFHH